MAMFNLLFASLVALFSSFLALSPTILHGLAPWFDSLSNHPVPPTPSASPKVFVTWDFWDEIPTANLSAPEISTPPSPHRPPSPHFPLNIEKEKVEQPFEIPLPEEPTDEELLRELWRLMQLTLLCLTIDLNNFVMNHPYLRSDKTHCQLRRLRGPIPSHYRSRSLPRFRIRRPSALRKRGVSCSPVLPSAPAPTPAPAPAVATSSQTSPPSAPPSPLSVLASSEPLAFLPSVTPSLPVPSPAFSPPTTLSRPPSPPPRASPQVQSRPSSPSVSAPSIDQRHRLPIVDHMRLAIERRERQKIILELEEKVKGLKSQVEEMLGRKLAPTIAAPYTGLPLPEATPIPPRQPVLGTGSAPLQLPQQHFGFGNAPSPLPQPFGVMHPPPGYNPVHPDQLSLEAFLKKYPQTGSKKSG